MSAVCPNCQAALQHTDKFCPACGDRITLSAWPDDDFIPLPGVTGRPDLRVHRKRRRRRPWYRRPLALTGAILALVLLVGSVGAVIFVQRQFDKINEISTPPPAVSGSVFDADDKDEIDTSPALRALELSETGMTGDLHSENPPQQGPIATASPAAPGATPAGDGSGGLQIAERDATPEAEPSPTPSTKLALKPVRDPEGGSRTILLMSVDAPEGEPIDSGLRPDQLAVLHFDGDSGVCRVLSIPTGMRTDLPGYGESRINHALAVGGIRYEILVVEQMLGLKIDHFGLIDWGSVDGLVDAMGGVTVDNPEAFEADGFTFDEGEIDLDGEQALIYSREQTDDELKQEDSDDVAETRRNQVLRGLIAQTSSMDVVRSATSLLNAVEGHIKSDLKPTQMIGLASDYRTDCTSETLETASLEGDIETYEDPLAKKDLTYTVVAQDEIDHRVEWLIEGGDDADATPAATPE
jgi:polyisoprenyl-teichoic acid--peptidoglycan teichoic acid transferase